MCFLVHDLSVDYDTQDREQDARFGATPVPGKIGMAMAGQGFNASPPVTDGSLALFCPACPQPGVNLPQNWTTVYPQCAKLADIRHHSNHTLQGIRHTHIHHGW